MAYLRGTTNYVGQFTSWPLLPCLSLLQCHCAEAPFNPTQGHIKGKRRKDALTTGRRTSSNPQLAQAVLTRTVSTFLALCPKWPPREGLHTCLLQRTEGRTMAQEQQILSYYAQPGEKQKWLRDTGILPKTPKLAKGLTLPWIKRSREWSNQTEN